MADTNIAVLMKGITKVYPNGIAANQGVDFSVKKGEIQIGRASCRERVF